MRRLTGVVQLFSGLCNQLLGFRSDIRPDFGKLALSSYAFPNDQPQRLPPGDFSGAAAYYGADNRAAKYSAHRILRRLFRGFSALLWMLGGTRFRLLHVQIGLCFRRHVLKVFLHTRGDTLEVTAGCQSTLDRSADCGSGLSAKQWRGDRESKT
jgi:hypothetical protein